MDTTKAVSEPLRRIIDHHNAFNKRVKLLVGSLNKVMSEGLENDLAVSLPYGDEPWGETMRWSSSADGYAAEALLAELGIVRAASAFEDYLKGVIAELDRAGIPAPAPVHIKTDWIERVFSHLALDPSVRPPLNLVRFFDCARNCIVHQMGRANAELVDLSVADGLAEKLSSSTPRAKAKWKPTIPATSLGAPVSWKPRHAILASDAYYKAAVAIDQRLIALLGNERLVAMAAYWAVTAQIPIIEPRRSLIATIHCALNDRYSVKMRAKEIGPALKSVGKWEKAKSSFQASNPDRPIG